MVNKIKGKKICIVVAQEFEDVELLYPVLQLSYEGADISIVPVLDGFHTRPMLFDKPVTGRFGHTVPIPVMAEGNRYSVVDIDSVSLNEIDCLLFPGGYSPDLLRINKDVLSLTKKCFEAGKIIAAICHGPWVLISAGLSNGLNACGYEAVHDDLKNSGAKVFDVPAIRDGNIITGRVPDDLPEFCEEIVKALSA